MNKEFSAGAVIFKRESSAILFLIIYSKRNNIWGFPKGHIEQGETARETASREIKEEIGLENLNFIESFKEEVAYEMISERSPFKNQRIKKYVTYFLCETGNQDIIIDNREILDYRFLPLDKAGEMVKFRNLNVVLRRAYDFLQTM